MPLVRCPICKRMFDTEKTRAMPFCSPRCQRVDFGRWLNEDYGIPVEPDDEEFDQEHGANGDE